MSSRSYLPPPVKAVSIPNKSGGVRVLGVPTVSDRIAQMVVKLQIEPILEPVFFCQIPMATGQRNLQSMLSVLRVAGAGNRIGFWSLTSEDFSTTSRMIYY